MKNISFGKRLRYSFDNTMSKGTSALIMWLGLLSLVIVVMAGLFIVMFEIAPEGEEALSFFEAVWRSMMRTLDAGTMGGDQGWSFRLVQFVVTIGGIFIISTLIGVISSGIETILSTLRKGRSFVIEENHTLILGWSPKVFTMISELIIANENQKKGRIVILADKDKVEMEDEVKERIPYTKNTKVICRSGSPNDFADISIANPQASKSIIILSSEEETADMQTIKTILAITNNPDRREEPYHIVAEIKDEKNLEVTKMVGKDEVELVLTDDIVARIMTQTSRQSGLSVVYTELMDFDGAEIYFNEEELLAGKTYGEALVAYKDSAVIGLQLNDNTVTINPDMNYVIKKGEKVIAITEDDDTLIVDINLNHEVNASAIVEDASEKGIPDKTLLLGWNKRAYTIIAEMDSYSSPGSLLKIVSTYPITEDEQNVVKDSAKNMKLEFVFADTTNREVLNSLNILSFGHVILLCYKDELDIQEADAHTLVTLLHLRSISETLGKTINIVSEMLDLHNRELAEVTKADDFIVSDKLISLLMTQVSENKYLMRVFEILFDAEGSEIYLKPVTRYVKTGTEVNFYTVLESAKRKGETAIGYRISAEAYDSSKSYGVRVNPVKTDKVKFTTGDKIIVLAED
ncbi:MAG: CASTOR/POLLUX-related putative ion channel [Ignavibacteria bacterium]